MLRATLGFFVLWRCVAVPSETNKCLAQIRPGSVGTLAMDSLGYGGETRKDKLSPLSGAEWLVTPETEPVKIVVGKSDQNWKCVKPPAGALVTCAKDAANRGKRINADFHSAKDKFEVHSPKWTRYGDICVYRVDGGKEWGMDLMLKCTREKQTRFLRLKNLYSNKCLSVTHDVASMAPCPQAPKWRLLPVDTLCRGTPVAVSGCGNIFGLFLQTESHGEQLCMDINHLPRTLLSYGKVPMVACDAKLAKTTFGKVWSYNLTTDAYEKFQFAPNQPFMLELDVYALASSHDVPVTVTRSVCKDCIGWHPKMILWKFEEN